MSDQASIMRLSGLGLFLCLLPALAWADGAVVDKLYHPYVDAMETELEYRSLFQERQDNLTTPAQIHQFSIGRSIGERCFSEFYVVGTKDRSGDFDVEALEAELKWQITEQGEYAADWGMLFEYENELGKDIQEVTAGLLSEREFGRWSGTANLRLIYEWGGDINNEFESVLALQARYRRSPGFEPGIEFYSGQNTLGMGPVIQGTLSTGIRKKLHWETGVIFGMDHKSADTSVRFLLEYEF